MTEAERDFVVARLQRMRAERFHPGTQAVDGNFAIEAAARKVLVDAGYSSDDIRHFREVADGAFAMARVGEPKRRRSKPKSAGLILAELRVQLDAWGRERRIPQDREGQAENWRELLDEGGS